MSTPALGVRYGDDTMNINRRDFIKGLTVVGAAVSLPAVGATAAPKWSPVIQDAPSMVEILNDFEQGWFNPIVNGVRWRGAVGRYTKIGQIVNVNCKIVCPMGIRELSGFPYNPVGSPAAAVERIGNQYLISTSYRVGGDV